MEKDTKHCPFCGEEIKKGAIKCKHCGEFLNKSFDAGGAQNHSFINFKRIGIACAWIVGFMFIAAIIGSTLPDVDNSKTADTGNNENEVVETLPEEEYIPEPTDFVSCKGSEMEKMYFEAARKALYVMGTEQYVKYNNHLEDSIFKTIVIKTGNYDNEYKKERVCYAEVVAIPSDEQRVFLLDPPAPDSFTYVDKLMFPMTFDQTYDKISETFTIKMRGVIQGPDISHSDVRWRAPYEEFAQARGLE